MSECISKSMIGNPCRCCERSSTPCAGPAEADPCSDAGDGTCTIDHQQSETVCDLPGGYRPIAAGRAKKWPNHAEARVDTLTAEIEEELAETDARVPYDPAARHAAAVELERRMGLATGEAQCCHEAPGGMHSENCPTRADEEEDSPVMLADEVHETLETWGLVGTDAEIGAIKDAFTYGTSWPRKRRRESPPPEPAAPYDKSCTKCGLTGPYEVRGMSRLVTQDGLLVCRDATLCGLRKGGSGPKASAVPADPRDTVVDAARAVADTKYTETDLRFDRLRVALRIMDLIAQTADESDAGAEVTLAVVDRLRRESSSAHHPSVCLCLDHPTRCPVHGSTQMPSAADAPTLIEPGDPREVFMRGADGSIHAPATTSLAALERLRATAIGCEYVPREITNKDYEQVERALRSTLSSCETELATLRAAVVAGRNVLSEHAERLLRHVPDGSLDEDGERIRREMLADAQAIKTALSTPFTSATTTEKRP